MQRDKTKTTYLYNIGNGLTLMSIQTKNADGKLDRVDTYIAMEDFGFSKVGTADNLSEPGVIFKYSSFVRQQEAMLGVYIETLEKNTGMRVKESGGRVIGTSLDGKEISVLK